MRIVGHLSDDISEENISRARKATLSWISRRSGRLPSLAWRLESFVNPIPGNSSAGLRLSYGDTDWWTARYDDPDKDVPGRTWNTEVTIVRHQGAVRFGLRLEVVTREPGPRFAPAVPGIVRQLAAAPGLQVDGHPITDQPWIVEQDSDLPNLIGIVEDSNRRAPVIVVALGEGEADPSTAVLDVATLARRILGLAHVVVLTDAMTFHLTKTRGKRWSCFNNAVRIYNPGFNIGSDSPFDHPLYLPYRVKSWSESGSESFIDYIARVCGSQSLRRLQDDHDIPPFSRVRQVALQLEREQASASGAGDAELLDIAVREREAAQADATASLELAVEAQRERNEANDEARRLRGERHALSTRIAYLETRLRELGREADTEILIPTSFRDIREWAQQHLTGRLELTSRAARAAEDSVFENVQLAYQALVLLATLYRDSRRQGGDALKERFENELSRLNLANTPTGERDIRNGGDEFRVDWRGRKQPLAWHLKSNSNTRDPRRCFRLYYFYDEEDEIVVVGSLPSHLTTRFS